MQDTQTKEALAVTLPVVAAEPALPASSHPGPGPGIQTISAVPTPLAIEHTEEKTEPSDAVAAVDANKTRVILKALKAIEQNLTNVIRLLESEPNASVATQNVAAELADAALMREVGAPVVQSVDGRVVEGVFDGQNMVGSDGKVYTVPANYASKSKLVEGDLMKLTITPRGSFIYKQIGPIERSRVMAILGFDPTTVEYYATTENRRWNVIKASVTYFKGEPGDEVVLLVPKTTPSKWAAVENVIKKNPLA